MTKSQKRLEKMRQNPKNVSYEEFVLVLEEKGYTIRTSGGSHYIATINLGERAWTLTFVRPHGNKKEMNHKGIRKTLEQFAEIDAWQEEQTKKEEDNG